MYKYILVDEIRIINLNIFYKACKKTRLLFLTTRYYDFEENNNHNDNDDDAVNDDDRNDEYGNVIVDFDVINECVTD